MDIFIMSEYDQIIKWISLNLAALSLSCFVQKIVKMWHIWVFGPY